jgi:hypothetical protein
MQCTEYEVSHSSKSSGFDNQTSKIKASSEIELKQILESRGRKLVSIHNKKVANR